MKQLIPKTNDASTTTTSTTNSNSGSTTNTSIHHWILFSLLDKTFCLSNSSGLQVLNSDFVDI